LETLLAQDELMKNLSLIQAHLSDMKSKVDMGMHFIQPPQHIVVKLVQLRRKNAISGRWLSQVHTQKSG
jgi:hypothetical protein